jgi:hypothetical protein
LGGDGGNNAASASVQLSLMTLFVSLLLALVTRAELSHSLPPSSDWFIVFPVFSFLPSHLSSPGRNWSSWPPRSNNIVQRQTMQHDDAQAVAAAAMAALASRAARSGAAAAAAGRPDVSVDVETSILVMDLTSFAICAMLFEPCTGLTVVRAARASLMSEARLTDERRSEEQFAEHEWDEASSDSERSSSQIIEPTKPQPIQPNPFQQVDPTLPHEDPFCRWRANLHQQGTAARGGMAFSHARPTAFSSRCSAFFFFFFLSSVAPSLESSCAHCGISFPHYSTIAIVFQSSVQIDDGITSIPVLGWPCAPGIALEKAAAFRQAQDWTNTEIRRHFLK